MLYLLRSLSCSFVFVFVFGFLKLRCTFTIELRRGELKKKRGRDTHLSFFIVLMHSSKQSKQNPTTNNSSMRITSHSASLADLQHAY